MNKYLAGGVLLILFVGFRVVMQDWIAAAVFAPGAIYCTSRGVALVFASPAEEDPLPETDPTP